MRRDLVLTFFTQIFVLISTLLLYRLVKIYLGDIGFTTYSLTRRNVSFLLPAFSLGLGVALPKYIAFSIGEKSNKENAFFVAGLLIILVVISLIGIIVLFASQKIAFLLYGNSKFSYFIFPIFVSIAGTLFHFIAYAYFRGRLEMIQANTIQLINLGIIPLISFFLSTDIREIFLYNGILIFIVSSITVLFVFIHNSYKVQKSKITESAKELIGYGIQRVPGDFGLAAFLALPAIIYSHIVDIETAGYIAFGISLLNMAGQMFAPIGQIYLPKISNLIASENYNLVKNYSNKLLVITIILTLIGVLVFELFSRSILEIYLGNVKEELVYYTRIILLAALGFTIYVSMRSIIDAVYKISYNSINIIISLTIFIVLSALCIYTKIDSIYFIFSFLISMYFLMFLTIRKIFSIYKMILRTGDNG